MTESERKQGQSWGAPAPILVFAAAAHFLHHVLVSLYLTLVLVLVNSWQMTYGDLIALWTIGSMMIGLGAPLAGWLADRWGETKLMITLFFGLGVMSILCGFADGPVSMQIALTLLGVFGAIYHPVGNAWVVHHATEPGKAVASAGIAGSFGVAAGPIIAGVLTGIADWRMAFILPGLISALFGIALTLAYTRGTVTDSKHTSGIETQSTMAAPGLRTVFLVLGVTMTLNLVVYNAFTTALPKAIELATHWDVRDLAAIGLAVGAIHLSGAFAQFVGGNFADRGALRFTYAMSFLLLGVVWALAFLTQGLLVLPLAVLSVVLFELAAPLETLLVARMAPPARRGLFFGLRYALSTVGAPLGVALVAALYDPSIGFATLMLVISILALVTFVVSLFLPSDRSSVPVAVNAAAPITAFQAGAVKPPAAE